MGDYIPRNDHQKLAKLQGMSQFITGHAAAIGISTNRASAFADLVGVFQLDLETHDDKQAQAKAATATKDLSAAAAVAEARAIAQVAQASPNMTPGLKEEMGIPVHDATRSPVPPPTVAPGVAVQHAVGINVLVRAFDPADVSRRAKPEGVAVVQFFTAVGPTPPMDLNQWRLAATSGRVTVTVPFTAADAGKQAWICARALNGKGEAGPVGDPVGVTVAAAIAA